MPSIINGQDVSPPGKYPWQASLQVNGRHICGGALISSSWVLTAAHCVEGSNSGLTVVMGMHDIYKSYGSPRTYRPSRVIRHSGYSSWTLKNDIALIQLSQTVSMSSYVKTIQMDSSTANFPPGSNCVITGWGYTIVNGRFQNPTILQEANTKIISVDECRQYFSSVGSSHVCLRNGFTGGCMGDSGGPLACQKNGQWSLVGLTSFGRSDCNPVSPSVYTRVASFRSWVSQYSGV